MASNIQEKKPLKEVSNKEAAILLGKIKFKTITSTLLSGEYGEITGEVLEELDDETLQSIGINIPFQRKQFLKSITKYKSEGVPIDLLRSDVTLKKQSLETDQTTVDGNHTLSMMESRTKLHKLLNQSEKILEASSGEMDIYAFPAKKVKVKNLKIMPDGTNLKKMIIMGETGSGKSTLIDAVINYAVGVKMEDPFRFKLVVDEDERGNNQTVSQTPEISGYSIKNTLLDFPIQIWDTPGFGDTRGIERDEEIKQQINELLKLEDFCHAVCFVVKASVNRLTETQKYIIDRVLLFFGKEAQENIYVLVTFADDSRPDVLQALEKCKNFPFAEDRCFTFNNGSLFRPASARTSFSKVYWEITNNNLDKLFNKIGEICPFSLFSTKQVIKHREDLAQNLNVITVKLGDAAFRKNVWEKNLLDLQIHQDTLIDNGRIMINIPRTKISEERTSTKNTICKKCHSNCHIGCGELGKFFCVKFKKSYKCEACGCSFNFHKNVHYKYETTYENYEMTYETEITESSDLTDSWLMYEKATYDSEQGRNQEQAQVMILLEDIKQQIININATAMLNYSIDITSYFEHYILKEEDANNFEQANIYKKLCQEENLMINLMKHNEEATVQTAKRILSFTEDS